MGEPAKRVSYAEYLELESASDVRLEFVAGMIYAMAGETSEHARLAANWILAIGPLLRDKGCAVFTSDLKIRIDATDRTTYADAVVVCGPDVHSEVDPNAITNPTVIVEVLSPSTEASDRGEKWRHYQRLSSLREYVLISQGEPYIEVSRRDGDEWILRTSGAGQSFELPSRGVSVAVDDVYRDARDVHS